MHLSFEEQNQNKTEELKKSEKIPENRIDEKAIGEGLQIEEHKVVEELKIEQKAVEEQKTIPLFDSLNADVFSEIETPPGVEKTGEHQGGILSAYHGRYLWIDYYYTDPTDKSICYEPLPYACTDALRRLLCGSRAF